MPQDDMLYGKTIPRLKNKPLTKKSGKRPSDLMAEREKEAHEKMSLGEALMAGSAAIPPGEGPAGRTFKSIMGGAAAGATLGEALADMYQKKAQAGAPKPSRTVSEEAVAGPKPDGSSEPPYIKRKVSKRRAEVGDVRGEMY